MARQHPRTLGAGPCWPRPPSHWPAACSCRWAPTRKPVTLLRTAAGTWKAALLPPKNKAGGFVSLKASAEADGGLGVSQEIIRAVGLR